MMIKVIGSNSIHFVGKIKDIQCHLAAIENKNLTLAEYIKLQLFLYKQSLN